MRRSPLAAVVGLALCAIAVPAVSAAGSHPAPPSPAPTAQSICSGSATPAPTPAPSPAAHPVRGAATCVPVNPNDPLYQQIQAALAQQAQLQATKLTLAGEVQAAQDQQTNLEKLVDANRAQVASTVAKIADQEAILADADARAARFAAEAAEARRQERQDKALLSQYLRTQYVSQNSFVTFLLAADGFADLLSRAAMLNHLADSGARLVQTIQGDIHRAEDAEHAAQAAADQARAAAASLITQRDQLTAQMGHEQDLIGQLGQAASAAVAEIHAADSQDAALAQQVSDLRIQELDQAIAQSEQAAWDEASYYVAHQLAGLPPGLVPPVGTLPPGTTRFLWPAPGTVIAQGFGPSPYPFEPPAFGLPHFHTGVDLAGPMGTPIYAAAAGIVAAATPGTVGYGNHVIIAHDGHALTLYGHLEVMLVKPGQVVRQGQPIALMGSTGNSTGPHLHFELRVENVPADPTPLLPELPPGASGPPALTSPPPLPPAPPSGS